MRADTATVKTSPEVAVVAEHLEAFRPAVGFQPSIDRKASGAEFVVAAMLGPVLVDVVDAQEREIGLAAARALTAVRGDRREADLETVPLVDRVVGFGVLFAPARTVLVGIGDEFVAIRKVVGAVTRLLSGKSFLVRESC